MRIVDRLQRSSFARDIGHLTAGQGLRLVIQAVYFVLIARILGPGSYGVFASIVALAALLTPFSGLGTANLFVKNVRSGRRKAALCWGNGLVTTMVSGTVFVAAILAIDIIFNLRIPLGVVAGVGCSDLILMRIIELAVFGFGAIGRMKEYAIQGVISSALRLAAIVLLAPFGHRVTLLWWTWAYVLATVAGTAYAIWRAWGAWGRPEVDLGSFLADAREGIYFSVGGAAATVYNDIDKVMLGKVSFSEVGIYSAAYRIIDVSMTPVRALTAAAYPHFFRLGIGGVRQSWGFARTQIGRACLYSLILAPALWIGAPLLPHLRRPRLRGDGAGHALACTAAPDPQRSFIPGRCPLRSRLAGAAFNYPSGSCPHEFRNEPRHFAEVRMARRRLDHLASDGLLLISLWIAVRLRLRSEAEVAFIRSSADCRN